MHRVLLIPCLATIVFTAMAQGKTFDQSLSDLRKDVISVCGQLQSPGEGDSPERLAAAVDSLITAWDSLKMQFIDNPPAEYAKDPAWRSYFSEAGENFGLMRTRASEGNFKRAVQFCGMNCALFVKIHQVNGLETVTDRLFVIRQAVKTSQAMVSADNTEDAVSLLKKHLSVFDKMPQPVGEESAKVKQDIDSLKKGYKALMAIVARQGKEASLKEYARYLKAFKQIYADNI